MEYDDYSQGFTEPSMRELENFIKWMNEKKGSYPIIIGSWAVYAYSPVLGSKDIDTVLPTDIDLNNIILEEYFSAHGFVVKKSVDHMPLYYYKEVYHNGIAKEIIMDLFVGNSTREDSEGLGIRFNWEDVVKNTVLKEIQGLRIYVPKRELLILLKVIAALSRSARRQRTQNEAIEAKIWKDYHDIGVLISDASLDRQELARWLEKANVSQYVEKFLSGYQGSYSDVLEKLGLPYERLRQCFLARQ